MMRDGSGLRYDTVKLHFSTINYQFAQLTPQFERIVFRHIDTILSNWGVILQIDISLLFYVFF